MPVRIAASLALLAFAASLVAAVAVGASFDVAVWRALGALVVGLGAGLLAGGLAEIALKENLKARERVLADRRERQVRDINERSAVMEVDGGN